MIIRGGFFGGGVSERRAAVVARLCPRARPNPNPKKPTGADDAATRVRTPSDAIMSRSKAARASWRTMQTAVGRAAAAAASGSAAGA